jgi:hypothetical protein
MVLLILQSIGEVFQLADSLSFSRTMGIHTFHAVAFVSRVRAKLLEIYFRRTSTKKGPTRWSSEKSAKRTPSLFGLVKSVASPTATHKK